jgi:hypothetical protein
MTETTTEPTLLERLKANPRFKEAGSPRAGIIIVGAKPSVAQKPQATDAAPHADGDERSNAS